MTSWPDYNITFVRTSHFYESYRDMLRLAEISGFPLIYENQVDITQDGVYIFITMNGDVEAHIRNQLHKPRYAHLIQWNIERPSGSAGSVGNYARRQRQLINERVFDEVWVSDRRLADETQLRFVILGSDEALGEPSQEKRYDFCHMSYQVPRRVGVYKHFDENRIGHNCWPPERDEVLRQSRFALNIHQDIHPFQEPLRFALFAAYGLPIISESIYDMWPWSDETMITVSYDSLVQRLRQALTEDYEPYKEMGMRAREMMCKTYRFRDTVLQACKESLDRWR